MPDLEDIRTFSEVVDSGSLTRAGARLGMSKSMISRRLARLEAELGTPLLARSTRGLSLTEAGSDFRPYAERMVAELQSARDAVSRQGEASGRLRLTAPISFGSTHLAPVLAELAVRHPRLEISASFSDRMVDVVGEGFDAAVRLGNLSRFDADRPADRAGAGGDGGEPGVSRAAGHAAHAGGSRRARRDPAWRCGLALPQGRQALHPPAARALHRRQRAGGAGRGGGGARHRGDAGVPRRDRRSSAARSSGCSRTTRSRKPGSTSSGRRRPSRCR